MKKFLAILLCSVILLSNLNTAVFASNERADIMPRFNNISSLNSSFDITDGMAHITVLYIGYPGVTTSARITIELQKRNLLVFWKDITSWVVVSYEEDDYFEYSYPVDSGTYRIKITYEISGTTGTTDVIEETIKDSY